MKLPISQFSPTWDLGRRWQNGPITAPCSTTDSVSTQYGLSCTRSPIFVARMWQPAPTTQSLPISEATSMITLG